MKSKVLFLLFLVVLCVSAPLRFIQKAEAQSRPEIRGVWIHTYSAFDWDAEMKKVADAGFNCVFARVARGVNSIYPSQFLARDDWAENQPEDELQKAIAAAHRNGLEFHAWRVCFNVGGAAKQKGGAKALYDRMAKEDRLVRGLDGKQSPFLNPADPRNQNLELVSLRELTEKYDIDGVHLDYIRYPDVPHYDFDYGAVSRREFEAKTKQKVQNWPQDVFSGARKWEYENWERENINGLVKKVYAQTKQLKPDVQVSAAVWRAHRKHRAAIKQDWILWAKNGWLDFVVPMDYTSDEAQFRSDMKSQIANSSGRILLAAGIGSYQHATPQITLKQIEIARTEGADGFVLFDYKPVKYEALLAALKLQARSPGLPYGDEKVDWIVGQGIDRKDAPTAFSVGGNLDIRVRPSKSLDLSELLQARAELQSLDGAPPQLLPQAVRNYSSQASWQFSVPAGRWRMAVSGSHTTTGQTFEIRGPIIEGLLPDKIAELRARDLPLKIESGVRQVAVYAGGMAASGLVRPSQNTLSAKAHLFYQLKPQLYREANVLILPQLNDIEEFSPRVVADLRNWVSQGGVLLLTHDSVGFRSHLRAFPEIGQGVALSKTKNVEVFKNEFGFSTGVWQHEYPDHVTIASGAAGKVIARDKDGMPILVGGSFGKGKVFLYGALLGYAPDGSLDAGETQLLMDLSSR